MRVRTHEQLERKNKLLFYYSKEDITEMLIDTETIIDVLKYKIKMKEEEIEKLENVIVGLECDVEILSEQIEDDCKAHEEANKWCKEAHELAIENKELKDKINKAIEFIHGTEYQYGDLEQDSYDYNMCFNEVEDLLKILKGEG